MASIFRRFSSFFDDFRPITISLDFASKPLSLSLVRYRTFNSFPSFGGYLSGFSFSKAVGYGLAAGLGRACAGVAEIKARLARTERRIEIKMNLMRYGILPYPGEKKATQVPRRQAAMAAIRESVPAPTVPPEATWRPSPQPVKVAPKVQEVIPARSVCAPVKQKWPAAVSETGGLRGSTATRWRR